MCGNSEFMITFILLCKMKIRCGSEKSNRIVAFSFALDKFLLLNNANLFACVRLTEILQYLYRDDVAARLLRQDIVVN